MQQSKVGAAAHNQTSLAMGDRHAEGQKQGTTEASGSHCKHPD